MASFAERLTNAYFHANRASIEHGHGHMVRGRMVGKSKGQFMLEAYPLYEEYEGRDKKGNKETRYRLVSKEDRWGRWKNEDSARRAYDKLTSKRGGKGYETSGTRYEKISEAFYGVSHREKIRGGREGLWRVDVKYGYVDELGQYKIEYRSFIMDSSTYTTLEDLPYLYSIVTEIVEEHMEYWQETGSVWENYDILDVEITPIRASTLTKEFESERQAYRRNGELRYREPTWGTKGQGRVSIDNLEIE